MPCIKFCDLFEKLVLLSSRVFKKVKCNLSFFFYFSILKIASGHVFPKEIVLSAADQRFANA